MRGLLGRRGGFRLVWAVWMLFLGVSLILVHTAHHVHSFSEYLWAFVVLDMPSSWCPTFMVLYGAAVLLNLRRVSRFAGLVLLPIGVYTLTTYTLEVPFSFSLFDYIYPQTIHVSELLTGLMTLMQGRGHTGSAGVRGRTYLAVLLLIVAGLALFAWYSGWVPQSMSETPVESTTPVFELPVREEDLNDVTKIQTYHDPDSSELHVGFDFAFEESKEIISPINGTVTSVHKHRMSNGLWIVDVVISVNSEWSTFIAFEPDTRSETVIDQQLARISVKQGDEVEQGQLLGNLLTKGDFAHIHWSVLENEEYVSPYDYCSPEAKAQMDALCERFDTQPAC
ncbi:peptidoglycan DD-metalloendopeptidase family protein [Candidatus Bathyarchaeota archaeon]|nr:peptidoglycan DD-metalloendopeptidase family protein [Candidatus Bathyarchaeota archaeon]